MANALDTTAHPIRDHVHGLLGGCGRRADPASPHPTTETTVVPETIASHSDAATTSAAR
ncbi:hypothetical protein ACLQ22_31215 [Micromonospora sp. DT178]